jgi:hypothetical protein
MDEEPPVVVKKVRKPTKVKIVEEETPKPREIIKYIEVPVPMKPQEPSQVVERIKIIEQPQKGQQLYNRNYPKDRQNFYGEEDDYIKQLEI